jgi:hypothetical protein
LKHLFWGDYKEVDKKALFYKILQYESDYIKKIKENYTKDEIKQLLTSYKPFTKYHEKRVKLLKNILFDEKTFIEELEWIL